MSYMATVRYGKLRYLGRFRAETADLKPQHLCVVKTDRGNELGTVLLAEELAKDAVADGIGVVLRRASREDLLKVTRIAQLDRVREMTFCRETIKKFQLPMKLVDVDHLFGGEKIIFYFISDTRVDFRDLVKQLAQEFKTRIELKQIGARDQAKLVGDVGHCGLSLCCATFLQELGGITMDMAKIQKHTSDPNKITGRCGKLLCCLRYEYSVYTEARDVMPAKGTKVELKKFGEVMVLEQNLLLRELTVERADGESMIVPLGDIVGGVESRVAGCNGCATGEGGLAKGNGNGNKPPEATKDGGEAKK